MILVDTGPLYALAMQRDALHPRAQTELAQLKERNLRLLISTSALLETQSLLLRRESPGFVLAYVDALLTGSDLINPSSADYLKAQALLTNYQDQKISLFDASLVVLATTLKVSIWTFDVDFDIMRAPVWRVG